MTVSLDFADYRLVMSRRRAGVWIVIAVTAAVVAAHFPIVFLGRTYVLRDALTFTLPARQFLARSLRAGHVPEWFDGVSFGAPFAGNPLYGVGAPLSWLLALAPSHLGVDLWTLLHVMIAGVGTAVLARRLGADVAGSAVAGATLATCGYVSSNLVNGMAPNLVWTPWVAWAADRFASADVFEARPWPLRLRPAAALAAFAALQLAAGEPISVVVAAILALGIVVARSPHRLRSLATLTIPALASLALAAVVLVPAVATLRVSARVAGLEGLAADFWSMHPARALEWVWPLAYGSEIGSGWYIGLLLAPRPGDPAWSFSLALGLPVLLLVGLAAARDRTARALLGLSAIFVVLALGRFSPLARVLTPISLLGTLARFPEKYVYGAMVLWSALAGVGFTRALAERPRRWLLAVSGAGALALASGAGALWVERPGLTALLAARARAWGLTLGVDAGLRTAVAGGVAAAIGAALFALGIQLADRRPRAAASLAALAIVGPLVVANWLGSPLVSRAGMDALPPALTAAGAGRPDGGAPRPRVLRVPPPEVKSYFATAEDLAREAHETLSENVAARFGFDALPGFEPGESALARLFWDHVAGRLSLEALTRLTSIEYVIAQDAAQLTFTPRAVVATLPDGWSMLAADGIRPRAFLAPRWFAVPTPAHGLRALLAPGRDADPGRVALVGVDPRLPQSFGGPTPCEVRVHGAEDVEVECDSLLGGHAVLLDEAAPGWQATVDGRDAPILIADGLFRAVAIPPGRHVVVFRYRTPGLRLGALISLASWAALALLLWRSRRPESLQSAMAPFHS